MPKLEAFGRNFDEAFAAGQFDVSLFIAATLCEDDPTFSDAIRWFRHAYRALVADGSTSRLAEFHDAVGVPLPLASVSLPTSVRGAESLKVDIVIPVHNGRRHLEACLASLVVQLSQNIANVVIVDDGSDEETELFVRTFCDGNHRFLSLRIDRSVGFTRAVSLGVQHSRSPFFVVLNSDTVVCEGWLEKLLSSMLASSKVGLVGAMSNAAAWQNLAHPVDEDGNFVRHGLSDYLEPARVQLCAAYAWPPRSVESPLVHGFCALVDRHAYDLVGHLDQVCFPRGYGEFQDLSIRFWDAGYRPRVATDCFIGHVGAGSLDLKQRGELSVSGRVKLYEKHSALRYLTFEAASIYSLPMRDFRQRFREFYFHITDTGALP